MILQKKNEQYFLTIPKKLVEALDWEKEDTIEIKIAGKNRLELVRE